VDEWLVTALISGTVTLVVALIANGVGFLLWKPQRKKIEAEAADILTGTAMDLIKEMKEQIAELQESDELKEQQIIKLQRRIDDLRERVKALEEENAYLREGAMQLESQVVDLGREPIWKVPRRTR